MNELEIIDRLQKVENKCVELEKIVRQLEEKLNQKEIRNSVERKCDNMGRVTIPKEFRRVFDIDKNTVLELSLHNSGIFITVK